MYSADSDGLHMDEYLVGLYSDVQIEQYLALEMQLERKLGNRNRCILSKDHTEVQTHHGGFQVFPSGKFEIYICVTFQLVTQQQRNIEEALCVTLWKMKADCMRGPGFTFDNIKDVNIVHRGVK